MKSLAPAEFSTETTYLNTAAYGLPPARGLAAVREATARWAAGRGSGLASDDASVETVRAGFARLLAGATPDDIGLGGTAAGLVGPVVDALAPGAEVLLADGEFSSVSMPFLHRGDLAIRFVPLEDLADRVRTETALVAVSVVQSANGRVTDLSRLRAATSAHGTRLLVDATQAAGWLPLRFADADYWICATYKWLMGARSVAFFAVGPEAAAALRPLSPGWYAAADRWAELYAPVALANSARRFDFSPDWLGILVAGAGLSLLEELTVEAVHAHDLGLADRFRAGLVERGYTPVPGRSAIVSVPGAAASAARLEQADIVVAARGGGLRFAFHLYNSAEDVDRALEVLGDTDA